MFWKATNMLMSGGLYVASNRCVSFLWPPLSYLTPILPVWPPKSLAVTFSDSFSLMAPIESIGGAAFREPHGLQLRKLVTGKSFSAVHS